VNWYGVRMHIASSSSSTAWVVVAVVVVEEDILALGRGQHGLEGGNDLGCLLAREEILNDVVWRVAWRLDSV